MQVHQLIYQSTATVATTPTQLQQLLRSFRARNQADNISGLLLYGEEYIMQVLDGPAPQVRALYQRIMCDVRHYNVCVLADGLVPVRAFGGWTMGFVQLDAAELVRLGDYRQVGQAPNQLVEQPHTWPELIGLLQEFIARERQPTRW